MLKKLSAKLSFSARGFTLIELLVVLGILGILAIALLAAINPVEQLNKAQDASLENVATEYVDASVQYYSVHNEFPWDAGCFSGTVSGSHLSPDLTTCTQTLIAEGELKSTFTNASNLTKIFVTNAVGTSQVSACFLPQSNSIKNNTNTKYNSDGSVNASCPGANTCYWCAE